MSDPVTMCAAFQATAAANLDRVALRTPGDGMSITWREYVARVRSIAAGLAGLGVRRGDTVAIMLTNRPEFHLVDTAVLHLGAVPFSVYNTSAVGQLAHVFDNAGNRIVITEAAFVETVRAVGGDLTIISVDDPAGVAEVLPLSDVESSGDPGFDFDSAWQAVGPADLATIIYTSGTTGPPKGVELTHGNVLTVTEAIRNAFEIRPGDRGMSYLPTAHVADRNLSHYAQIMFGTIITTVADYRTLAQALPDTRPHLFFAVPRVWQKLKLGVEIALAAEPNGTKRRIAEWAMDIGTKRARLVLDNKPVPGWLAARHRVADALVLSKVRHKLGLDQARVNASGAAAIPPQTLEFFWALGIPVYELWGLSETSGLGSSCRAGQVKLGTVGTAVFGVQVAVAPDGELLLRGECVMRGYRKDPVRTTEMIDADGWVHTGDIGTVDADGYVTIVDRKKELIITSSGKNMSPTNIENAMKTATSLIGQVVAIGDDRPYVSALIVLDPDAAAGMATQLGLPDSLPATVAAHPKVQAIVADAIRAGNGSLSRVEQIKRFRIVPAYWEPGGDELTPTLKLRRKPISEKYGADIDDLYAETPLPDTVSV